MRPLERRLKTFFQELPKIYIQAARRVQKRCANCTKDTRMTQDDTEEMGSTAFAELVDHPGTLAEIDLGFVAGLTLPTAERKLLVGAAAVDEAFDRRVAPSRGVACDQILIDPLSREALLDSQGDLSQVNLAETAATRAGAEGRNGWVWC